MQSRLWAFTISHTAVGNRPLRTDGEGPTKEHIHAAQTIYRRFQTGQADLYPGLVSGPYIQHNRFSRMGAMHRGYISRSDAYPAMSNGIGIDGDLGLVHVRYLDWGGSGKLRVSTS